MNQLLRLLFGIIPCLFLACDYSPSGSHYEEVNPNPTGVVRVTLNEFQDTIFIRGYMDLYFNLYLPNRSFYGHKLEFNGKLLSEGHDTGSGYFFNSEKYPDGFYEMKYSAYTNSGTGSLADKSGHEALVVSKTWVVLVENAPPAAPAVTAVYPENGQLKIVSEPYKGRFFGRLELRRKFGDMEEHPVAFSDKPNTTSWVDDTYVGGEATYRVVVHLNDKQYTSNAGAALTYYYPLPAVLSTTLNAANEVKITFSSTPFYRNYKSHYISTDLGFYETSNRLDTVVTFQGMKFGRDLESTLVTKPLLWPRDNSEEWYTSRSTIPSHGTAWGPFQDAVVHQGAATDRFIVWQEGTIFLVDASTLQVLKKRDVGYQDIDPFMKKSAVSVSGHHAYIALNNVIHKLNPATLQTEETFTLKALLPYSNYTNVGLSVSNTNRLVVTAQNFMTKKDTVYLLDMETRKVLTKLAHTGDGAISPDGKALRVIPHIYIELPNKSWQQQAHFSLSTYEYVFHPTKPWFGVSEETGLVFYSTATGARQKTIKTEAILQSYGFDVSTGHLYQNSHSWSGWEDYLYVYNIETGKLIRKLELASNVTAFVYKNRIFSDQRYINL